MPAREQGFSVATPAVATHREGVLCLRHGLVEHNITATRRFHLESPSRPKGNGCVAGRADPPAGSSF